MRIKILISVVILCAAFIALRSLYFHGYMQFNYPKRSRYPIRGIDVSHHQGKIEWNEIRNQGLEFVFIKATEGGDYKDPEFERNWKEASNAGLLRGAYHFFTFCKSGIEQAHNFISTVPVDPESLPPVIDFEFVGNCERKLKKEEVLQQLFTFIREVEEKYGKSPIIYVTYDSYNQYLKGQVVNSHIWIRDIFFTPHLPHGKEWKFWQYANRGRVSGIDGPVDLNVFTGDLDSLKF